MSTAPIAKQKSTPNPHCPVPGCRTKAPHAGDTLISSLVKIFADPVRITGFAREGMAQLLVSMQDDWRGKRQFAWVCRTRQPEELFYKTLYAVFFASEKELHHMVSGEYPSSFVPYYTRVNDELYDGRGKLTEDLPGLPWGGAPNTAMRFLHSGAHQRLLR